MKKHLIIIGLFFIYTSCNYIPQILDKDQGVVSDTSVVPILVFEGSGTMTWKIGTPWVEPGYHCSEVEAGADDLTDKVVVTGTVDVNTRGLYTIAYSVKNSFDLEKTFYRYVLVTSELSDSYDISGEYYQGFFPTSDNKMRVTKAETDGFWEVSNINDLSIPVKAYIADLGNKTYIITPTFYRKKVNLKILNCRGTSYYDDNYQQSGKPALIFNIETYYLETGEIDKNLDPRIWHRIIQ